MKRTMRLSQAVSTFGVGAIYDILGESLVMMDTSQWDEQEFRGKGRRIEAERLVAHLRSAGFPMIAGLHEPIIAEGNNNVRGDHVLPFMRFPRWLFCSSCRRMYEWKPNYEEIGVAPTCRVCGSKARLTPMRFITICESGHMMDVPWVKWAHSRPQRDDQKSCKSDKLRFVSGDTRSGGLESIAVECSECGASRNLDGITNKNTLKNIGVWCRGGQPWQTDKGSAACASNLYVVQRGAGNVYYPVVKSALTIPPESKFELSDMDRSISAIRANPLFSYLSSGSMTEDKKQGLREIIAERLGRTVADVLRAERVDTWKEDDTEAEKDLLTEEWQALNTEVDESDDRDKFITRHIAIEDTNIHSVIERLVAVVKLREVRALTGFYRYKPSDREPVADGSNDQQPPPKPPLPPDLNAGVDWLPAQEAYGEGIFITLNEGTLGEWERRPEIMKRAATIGKSVGLSGMEYFLSDVSPRFILLHTLAHLIIRRLAFDCGYSAASMRERIYCSDTSGIEKAGFLIYTTAGDSEGTLGGLVRQAEYPRFRETLLSALQDACNCSSDPICMESTGQGYAGINLAACHACSLVPETSCTHINLALDRALVIGDGGAISGYFEGLLSAFLNDAVSLK